MFFKPYFTKIRKMEKAMAAHSSTLARKIPYTEEPHRLQSTGSQRVGHTKWLHFFLIFQEKWNICSVKFQAEKYKPISSVQSLSHVWLLWPHAMQHTRLPGPSSTPRACSNSCPSCQWCHPTILSSVVPFSSCLQSFPISESFQMSQFFTSGGQNIGVSASASSVLPMNIQD